MDRPRVELPSPVTLKTARLLLTQPGPEDAARMVEFFRENLEHFAPWDPPRPPDFLTPEHWRERLIRSRVDRLEDRALRLVLFLRNDPGGAPVGFCNFTQIVRGPFQACYLGYGLGRRFEGQGYMSEALQGAIDHVFRSLGLHRIMANHIPENTRSGRLLRRLNFVVEGYARDYLFIAGAWRDHVLLSRTHPGNLPTAAP